MSASQQKTNVIDAANVATENNLRFFLQGLNTKFGRPFNATEKGIILNNFRALQNQIIRGVPVETTLVKGIQDTINEINKLQIQKPDLREYQMAVLQSEGDDPTHRAFVDSTGYEKPEEVKGENVRVVQLMDITNPIDFKLFINPSSLYTYKYVAMHSDYRDTSSDSAGVIRKFSWKFAPTRNIQVGFCNGVSEIGNIIGMRLYQPRVPYVAAMNTTAKRVSILIEEFSAQSFGSSQNSSFHFIYRPIYVSGQTSIELSTEDYNDGIYSFRKPIKSLDSISLIFKDPTTEITFTSPFDAFFIAIEFTCLKNYDDK